ncbi:MAG: HD domain-containing phosphohydrolase [Planctomycetota bacterium]|jgi:HD-GYP domain-containing protein (c-di-GMP phosphodiesterase class II)
MLETIGKNLKLSQSLELTRFGDMANKLGVNFAVCDADGQLVMFEQNSNSANGQDYESHLIRYSQKALAHQSDQNESGSQHRIYRFGENDRILSVVLKSANESVGVAMIDTAGKSEKQIADDSVFSEMLGYLAQVFRASVKGSQQIEMVSGELAQTYEELVLLHKLSTNMKITELDANYLQMACDNLTDIVSVEGIAILLEKTVEDDRKLVLAAGAGLIDTNEQMTILCEERLLREISCGKEALLDSEVDSPFKYQWGENLKNIIVVPLYGSEKSNSVSGTELKNENTLIGIMVAINRLDKPDFDSTDVKLFNSVANGCAVFVENGRLFNDIKELFVGSLRALTNSIDIKDRYTRGHSERVAYISRWIAERIDDEEPLSPEQIHRIYLGGLLHDIGKMGIDESILRKKNQLTDMEYQRIKTHPSAGARILNEIKQMHDVIPGVLYHHERIDGKGYPNGLADDQIPLIGKIIKIADSFDAMTSKRTYRDAMDIEDALLEIENGIGTQFDEIAARAFLDSDVYQLWEIIQNMFNSFNVNDFSQYSTEAVGTLLK